MHILGLTCSRTTFDSSRGDVFPGAKKQNDLLKLQLSAASVTMPSNKDTISSRKKHEKLFIRACIHGVVPPGFMFTSAVTTDNPGQTKGSLRINSKLLIAH